ncbi:MAG: hypothetical protein IPJ20_19480 [Flammeovirgaceae bacterium]|nr:hypothetical protein [Flammeovirgaceae bacterium]
MKKYSAYSFIVMVSFFSCKQKELKHNIYEIDGKEYKSVYEVENGKINGKFKAYNKAGILVEMSEWRNDIRNGKTISYYENGKVSGEYYYSNGKLVDEFRVYYENGNLKDMGTISIDGFVYNSKSFDYNGNILNMKAIVKISKEVINLGDTVKIRASVANVIDEQFKKGSLILGKYYLDPSKTLFKDTLAINYSDRNDYTLKFVPETTGDYDFIVQIVCYKKKIQDKEKSIRIH